MEEGIGAIHDHWANTLYGFQIAPPGFITHRPWKIMLKVESYRKDLERQVDIVGGYVDRHC